MSELFVEEGCHEFLFEAINDSFIGTGKFKVQSRKKAMIRT